MELKKQIMTPEKLQQSLEVKDLSDPANGIHAINLVVDQIVASLKAQPGWPRPEVRRCSPVSTVANNFDRLRFPQDNVGRSSTYTRYVTENSVLRTHTSAMIPDILDELRGQAIEAYLVVCPGICYRRDVVDKTHCGEPHQLDIWRIKKGAPRLERKELLALVDVIVNCLIPGMKYRANEVLHPYTIHGLEIEIDNKGSWLELLECGEAHPEILAASGLDPQEYSGLAMGIGLDRLIMLLKGIDDIRILRSEDPRIKSQLANLTPYRAVSKMPPVRQDMSFSVEREDTVEDVCEMIREAFGTDIDVLEEVKILSETQYESLPPKAIERLGIKPRQKNILARITLRSHERSLRQEVANAIRDRVYRLINKSGTDGYLG